MSNRVFITSEEISKYIGCSRPMIKELIESKILPAIVNDKGIRNYYYTNEDLIKFAYRNILKILDKKEEDINYKDAFLNKKLKDISFENSKDCKVLTITNMKGGIGKTTSSINIASALAVLKYKVLIVDMDPQAHSSRYFDKDKMYNSQSISMIFDKYKIDSKVDKKYISKYITNHTFTNFSLDILPSEIRLGRMLETLRSQRMPHMILDTILEQIKSDYDFIIIDTPPSNAIALEMSFYASDYITLIVEPKAFSVDSLEFTIEEIRELISSTKKDIKLNGILVSNYNAKSSIIQETNFNKILDIAEENAIDMDSIYVVYLDSLINKTQELDKSIFEHTEDMKKVIEFAEPIFKYAIDLIEK